jgi:class 3 adenylate cyclase/tetratricopeptide (TPR) repeat protein
VSVLFADLVGFTPFAEERDPEAVRDTLSRYFAVAAEVIERYGGRVEKFIGDAVMALWGAPNAHEDDAERAVRAGLDLVDAVRALAPGIEARAGVLTGEAAVTIGARNEGMVAGDLVNTAARLQAIASPGGVLVGETTMRAASAAITFEAAGDHALKGKAEPTPVWRALRVVAQRGGHGRSDLPEPPFVGRDEELRLLKDLLATSGRDRRPRLVSITGPAGIGKSRLAWELEKYIDGITESIYWHRGRSPSYGDGITFWALGEMVRRRAGLAEEDDAATTRAHIAATVREYVPAPEDARWVEPALLTLLGLEPTPPGGRDVLFAAWRIFFERVASRGPTILLFEDLQWADSGLLEFLEYLLEWARGVPLVVVTLARPDLAERRPEWGSGTRHLTRMALEPLSDDAMRELLAGLVPGLPSSAVAAIVARADGIPLYAVETVRALVAEGKLERVAGAYRPVAELTGLTVPDSLRSLIGSRLDALEPADRSLVADASVLGQTFTLAGLAAVTGEATGRLEAALRLLARRELFDLEADPRSPERGQYRFVQSLIREVAYGTLARRDRRARHLAAARFFETLGDEELAAALATHYVAAHAASDPGAEADAIAIQARLALGAAADRAVSLGGHDQAVAYLRSAVAVTAESGERGALLLRAARSANAAARHADAEALVQEALALGREMQDGAAIGAALGLLGEILIDNGQPPEAAKVLDAAIAELPADVPDHLRADLLGSYSRALMRTGEALTSIEVADRALAIAERLRLDRIVAETFNNKGSSLGFLGRQREALALLAAAVEVAREGGFVAAEIRALANLAVSDDDPRRARSNASAAQQLALRVGRRGLANWATEDVRFLSFVLADDWDEALAAATVVEGARDQVAHSPLDELRSMSITGLFRVARGEPTDALLLRLVELGRRTSDLAGAGSVHLLRSDRALMAGEWVTAYDEAIAATIDPNLQLVVLSRARRSALWGHDLDRARDVIRRLDALLSARRDAFAEGTAARAGVDALEGRLDDAAAAFREAIELLRSIGAELDAALMSLDAIEALGADHTFSLAVAPEARSVFVRIGAKPYLARLDAALPPPTATLPSESNASPTRPAEPVVRP